MITPDGHVESGFNPDLRSFLPEEKHKYLTYLERWGVAYRGMTAPTTDHGQKAAVWFGSKLSKYGEAPVLAVALDRTSRVNTYEAMWYIGVGEFGRNTDPCRLEVPSPALARLAIDAATHGPHDLIDAMDGLPEYMPVNSIVLG